MLSSRPPFDAAQGRPFDAAQGRLLPEGEGDFEFLELPLSLNSHYPI